MEWLLATVASALVGWGVASILGFVASLERALCEVVEWFRRPASGRKYTVLLPRLHGDSKGFHTRYVRNALLQLSDLLDVYLSCRTLQIKESTLQGQALADAEKTGRKWLRQRNCELLLWGEVDEEQNVVTLHFVHRDESLHGRRPILRQYAIKDIGLENNFESDVATQLKAIIASQIEPPTHENEYQVVERLKGLYRELRGIQQRGLDHLSKEHRGSFLLVLGGVITAIGEKSRNPDQVMEAVHIYREALDVYSRKLTPHAWATTQAQLAFAYMAAGGLEHLRGNDERGDVYLYEAVKACRYALGACTKDVYPMDWAVIQARLGSVYGMLGGFGGREEFLQESQLCLKAALEVFESDESCGDAAALMRTGLRHVQGQRVMD